MTKLHRRPLSLFAIAVLTFAVSNASAGHTTTWRMYVWMQPPANGASAAVNTDKACLTQRWHSSSIEGNSRALDWNTDCSGVSGENVYFRTIAAAMDDHNVNDAEWAIGLPAQSNSSCGGTTLNRTRVIIQSTHSGANKGTMSYQHTLLSSSNTLSILFKSGATGTYNGKFNSAQFATMTSDSSSCWTGYHVHENNHATSNWNAWNTGRYDAGALCDCHEVDASNTWTRQLHWIDS